MKGLGEAVLLVQTHRDEVLQREPRFVTHQVLGHAVRQDARSSAP